MAKKRDREFFICPRWQEVVEAAETVIAGETIDLDLHPKTMAAIKAGRPLARSTVRKALFAVRRASGSMFDVDDLIEDRRTNRSQG